MRRNVSWFLFLIVAGGAAAWAGRPLGRGSEVPPDDDCWFVVTLDDKKCGYMHSTMKAVGDEVHSDMSMEFEIARGDVKVRIGLEQKYRETLQGRPLGFCQATKMGQMPVSVSGEVAGGRIRVVTEQFGARREASYEFDPEIKFAWAALLEQRRRGLEPGTKYTIKTYEPTIKADGPIEMQINVVGREKVDVLGKPRVLTKVTSTMQIGMPMTLDSWVDDEAVPVVSTVDIGLARVRMYLATKEEALRENEAPEMFLSTLVRVDRKIDPSCRRLVLKLRVRADPARTAAPGLPDMPDTSMQKVQRLSPHEARVTITRFDWEKIRGVEDARPPPDLKEYLRVSTMLDIDDRRIRRLARRAVRGQTSPAGKADALRKYATQYIRTKSMDVGFATASEVAKTREGDCTEHGVFCAALARAAGLPARGVSGLVLLPGEDRAFGYHMWTQVYIGGCWVDIDAALRQTDVDPTHVALAVMPLNEEGMIDSISPLLALLGRLEIEVVESE